MSSQPLVWVQLAAVAHLSEIPLELVKKAQVNSIEAFVDMALPQLEAWYESMRTPTQLELMRDLLMDRLSASFTVPNAVTVAPVTAHEANVVAGLACGLLDKHSPGTLEMFRVIAALHPAKMSQGFPRQSISMPWYDNGKLAAAMREWTEVGKEFATLLPAEKVKIQRSPKPRLDFWGEKNAEQVRRVDRFPVVGSIVKRALALRTGIADVERSFNIFNNFQVPNRRGMKDDHLAQSLFLALNGSTCDFFAPTYAFGSDSAQ
jgi:hypothetical protein